MHVLVLQKMPRPKANLAEQEDTDNPLDGVNWSCLPDHILASILLYLDLSDRRQASLTCSAWNNVFSSPFMWRNFTFKFQVAEDRRFLKCIDSHGDHLYHITIELDQGIADIRFMGCQTIEKLADVEDRRLRKLSIKFTGENPYFYSGYEFVESLCKLFGKKSALSSLEVVDLSGLMVALNDQLLDLLSKNHQELRELNIDNKQLVCKVTPACILRLVERCPKLHSIHLFKCNLSEDVLLALADENRAPLKRISIACHREEKYAKDFSLETWNTLTKAQPSMRVTLKFDHNCPLHRINQIMQPGIPVSELRLETFTYIYDEVNWATECFKDCLELLVLKTPLARNSPELNSALISMAKQCKRLKELYVSCYLEKDTVEKLMEFVPAMKKSGKYHLQSQENTAA
jgi:F-box/leucine-rich repeat protein 8